MLSFGKVTKVVTAVASSNNNLFVSLRTNKKMKFSKKGNCEGTGKGL